MKNYKLTKKDKIIFWIGASTGIVGGLIGNVWAGYFFKFSDSKSWIDCLGVIIFTVILFGLLLYINKQIKNLK